MLVALGSIASQQTTPTKKNMSEKMWLLDYCATHPDATICYKRSGMVPWSASDASYLSEPKPRSRAGAIFFLSEQPPPNGATPTKQPEQNGTIHAVVKIMNNVMSSAIEAEVIATFHATKEAVPLRIAIEEMGHNQPPTSMQVDKHN